ncbi:alpha/beta hydrolase [Luteimonas vadosa]|uniref:Serine aminopeptidase S33 domain-containing protein n=1 Tax=Luteimonas vadosa TaxID=1165507 RepID=A0ABP9E522_9GAMM
MRIPLAKLLLVAMLACGAVPRPAHAAEPDPWAYFGLYTLQDGTLFHGGLLEEGDADIWIFGNPERPGLGGVYRKASATRFESLLRPGQALSFSELVDGQFQRIDLHATDGPAQTGRRGPRNTRRDVQIPAAGGTIGASLLAPACRAPHPTVVFVNGSGRTTRQIGDFATFLLDQGMAVLVYDKRDGDPATPGWQQQSLTEIGADAAAALAWAVAQPEIDPRRTGIFGSSQGGWTGAMAAVGDPGADFLIVRAGPGVTETEALLHETRNELRAEGLAGTDLDKAMDLRRELYALAVQGRPISEADALVAPWRDTPWYRKAFGDKPVSELWSARWWGRAADSMSISPVPYLERYDGPVLWFLGEDDENVPLVSSHAALSRTFARMPGDDQTLVVLEDAPHSFVVDAQSPDARYADDYLPTLRDWLATRTLSRRGCHAGK